MSHFKPHPIPFRETKLERAVEIKKKYVLLLLPDTSFPFLQGLLARVLGLWLIDLLEHHKIESNIIC